MSKVLRLKIVDGSELVVIAKSDVLISQCSFPAVEEIPSLSDFKNKYIREFDYYLDKLKMDNFNKNYYIEDADFCREANKIMVPAGLEQLMVRVVNRKTGELHLFFAKKSSENIFSINPLAAYETSQKRFDTYIENLYKNIFHRHEEDFLKSKAKAEVNVFGVGSWFVTQTIDDLYEMVKV
jgi:hypothetical protein